MRMLAERIDDEAILRLIKKWLKAGVLDTDGKVLRPEGGTPQGGVMTPLTQKVIWVGHRRGRAGGWCRRAVRCGARLGHGNRMAQRDRVVANQHFFQHKPEYLLTLPHFQRLGSRAQLGAKPGQAFG